jgi:hypothetical protein
MEGELAEKKLAVESIMDVLAPWARTTRLKKEGVWRNKYAPYPQSGEERNGTEQAKNIKLRDRMDLTKLSEYNNTMVCESLQSEFQSRAGQGRAEQGRAEQSKYNIHACLLAPTFIRRSSGSGWLSVVCYSSSGVRPDQC